MRNWFIGVLSGMGLMVLLVVLVVLVAIRISGAPPAVKTPTTIVLDLEGEILEQNSTDLSARLMQRGSRPTLRELIENIDKAAADKRVVAMVVRPRSVQFGWGKADEIRAALQRFRKSGKKLYCHMVHAGLREYYMATACEKVFMQPVGMLDIKGMRGEAMFWKGTLDKIGAQPQLVHTGDYKTYSNAFTETGFTVAHREMVNWLIDGLYGEAIRAVAEGRGKDLVSARSLIEAGPYEAPQAQTAGLVDQVLYEDEVYDLIKNLDASKRFNKMSARRYGDVPLDEAGLKGGRKIGVVYAVGTIMQGQDGMDPMGDTSVGSETMGRLLRDAGDDDSVKAVVLRVDSPGGDAMASDTIWRQMTTLRKKKPVVISMSDVAASGGYYISATGDPIVAGRNSITASIGVVYGKINIHGTYDKLGITKDVVTRGPYALLDSEYHAYTPDEWQRVQKLADDTYLEFKRKVAGARKMKVEDVDSIARGRVFTGEQAKQKGLVDELGGLDRALDLAKEKAGIPKTERIQVVTYPRSKSLIEIILEHGQSTELPAPVQVRLPHPLRALLAVRLVNSGRPMTLMPFHLEFR